MPLTEFELYSIAMSYKGKLPAVRNEAKDTQKFLALMNTKIEFIMRADVSLHQSKTHMGNKYVVFNGVGR